MSFNFIEHIRRQMSFSKQTFGPGERTEGVSDHIKKELREILDDPDDGKRSAEWIDVTLLALDGTWRALEAEGMNPDLIPNYICAAIKMKQEANERRDWPDWRTADPNKAIEHIRDRVPA